MIEWVDMGARDCHGELLISRKKKGGARVKGQLWEYIHQKGRTKSDSSLREPHDGGRQTTASEREESVPKGHPLFNF